MDNNLFTELNFNVKKEIFYEVLENKDNGFGYSITLKTKYLTELQIETLNFLKICYNKKLLGYVTLKFATEVVGDMDPLNRTIEKIEKTKDSFIISNSY